MVQPGSAEHVEVVVEARERLGFPTVSTHSFRKTVATALDEAGLSARAIAEYLGHENPSITQDVSMAKNTGGKRAAVALDGLLESSAESQTVTRLNVPGGTTREPSGSRP